MVFAVGETLTLPLASGVAAPISWSIAALVAPLVVHRSVAVPPGVIWNGSATSVAVIPGMTVTLPPSPTAVSV